MTGELHLEKPTVEQEVSRGLHFFDETLFEMAPDCCSRVDAALEHYSRASASRLPPFFQFGSWIGGDRDGNPFVTTTVTRRDVAAERARELRHYRARIDELAERCPSPSARCAVPESFRAELGAAPRGLRRCGADRGPQPRRGLTGNISPACCASSTPPSPAPRAGPTSRARRLRQCRRADPRSRA